MSRNRTRLLAALALVLANVAWPTAASAAPVTPEVFTSELAAAVSASGRARPEHDADDRGHRRFRGEPPRPHSR